MSNSSPVCPTQPADIYGVSNSELQASILTCGKTQFTGQLNLKIPGNPNLQWSLFFYLGHLISGESTIHSIRRWCRQIAQHCPQLAISPNKQETDRFQYWEQSSLMQLVKQQQISQRQMASVIEACLLEILFDLMQMSMQYGQTGIQLSYRPLPKHLSTSDAVLLPVNYLWHQASRDWQLWQQAELTKWSPNCAPVVWDAEELQRQTSLLVYHNLTRMADGNRTLRDIAIKLKHPVVPLAQSLKPYIQKGIMGLVDIGDLVHTPGSNASAATVTQPAMRSATPAPTVTATNPPLTSPIHVQPSDPLVAYIEDSRFDCIAMGQILAQAGYRFINIRDPIQALPILLEQKPSLIFLDLLMPVTNGYEVCTQIRRISAFKDIPVIIVTSSDGIVDRVRAKLAGAAGFVSKPIEPEKVLSALRNHLPRRR